MHFISCLICCGILSIFEPLLINFVYLKNISLFNDLFLTKKNQDRLRRYYYAKFVDDFCD